MARAFRFREADMARMSLGVLRLTLSWSSSRVNFLDISTREDFEEDKGPHEGNARRAINGGEDIVLIGRRRENELRRL